MQVSLSNWKPWLGSLKGFVWSELRMRKLPDYPLPSPLLRPELQPSNGIWRLLWSRKFGSWAPPIPPSAAAFQVTWILFVLPTQRICSDFLCFILCFFECRICSSSYRLCFVVRMCFDNILVFVGLTNTKTLGSMCSFVWKSVDLWMERWDNKKHTL